MGWQWTPYSIPLVFAGLSTVGLSIVGWRHRDSPGGKMFTYLSILVSGWVWLYLLQLLRTDFGLKALLSRIYLSLVPLVVLTFFLFAVEFTGHERWLTKPRIAALGIVPVIRIVGIWTNQYHGFIYSDLYPTTVPQPALFGGDPQFVVLTRTWEIGFWIHNAFAYVLMIVGSYLLLQMLSRARHIYRRQAMAIIVGVVVPFAANAVTLLNLNPFAGLDLTPFSFVVTGVALSWAVVSPQLLDLEPVARETVIDEMHESVLVLNEDNRVVDINPRAEQMLGVGDRDVIGMHIDDVLPDDLGLFEAYGDREEFRDEITVPTSDTVYHYDLRITPLYDHQNRLSGRLVLAHDITDRKQYEQALEQQNEHLDRFASVVSHDLRNPLNVAGSSLALAKETGDEEYIDDATDSLDRMDRIIDDVLTLARQGQNVSDLEMTDLESVVEAAWGNVTTADATLENNLAVVVPADRSRLLQVFENLFRNSIEHGRDDVTIRIGPIDDGDKPHGFYIADDGPGIPEDAREEIFEYGYTGGDGTGFGLAIVRSIVDAHDWTIEATESEDGGARLEITGFSDSASIDAGTDDGAPAAEATTDDETTSKT